MSKVLLLIFGAVWLFGSNILSYNFYNRTDRVDVMFTFDTPFEGKIIKNRTASKIILKLYDVEIESSKIKKISSDFLTSISIVPMLGYTQVIADVPNNNIMLKVSRTADAYGLRLRFVKASASKRTSTQTSTQQNKLNLPTQTSPNLSTSYYVVVIILVILILVMVVLKRKVASMNPESASKEKKNSGGWLFNNQKSPTPTSESTQQTNNVTIRFQKAIDSKNNVVMIDFLNQSYLVLFGEHNNILLDKFVENKPSSQDEFENMLQEKNEQLENYIMVEQQKDMAKDELQSFSQKASKIPYEF